ncbi:MAG: CHAT domain-containing protein, partial [Scytonema sp. PMC 1069.18]|nr:CHAT domain-containing protein [Scytonema sp. PMC 1069.18]MEC4886951.1 CHAT domain-containing protein [Scytonema sp. PMC 1070.18]
ELMRAVGNRRGEAVTLNNIGGVYSNLGEFQQALEYYTQALPIRQEVGDRRGEATALTNIAAVYDTLGKKQLSLDYYQQALQLWLAIGNRTGVAKTLDNIGVVYFDLGEFQQALDYYEQALPIRQEVGDRRGEAITLNNIGVVYSYLGLFQQALEYYNEALPIKQQVGDISGTVTTHRNLAVAERNLGNFNEALAQIESAIATIETLRTKVISQDLRASYLASVRHYYEFYIDLLMQLHQKNPTVGYAVKALEVSERARARSLVELLEEARADIQQGVDPKLRDSERQLQQQLASKTQALQKLLQGRLPEEIEEAEITQMECFRKEINSLQTQLREVEAEIRIKSPRYAALKYPLPLSAEEIQRQVVDNQTVLLSYWLGDEHSYLWGITSTSITSHELPKSSDIEATAREFYEYLTVPEKREKTKKVAKITKVLSQMLLEPVTPLLGCKQLLVVSDGALQRYVPFSTLLDPLSPDIKPMFVEHEIVSLPSASTLTQIRRDRTETNCVTKTVAVLADPVFDKTDERVNASVQAVTSQTQTSPSLQPLELVTLDISCRDGERLFARLPFSRLEAEEIQKLVPKESSLLALDFDASRETATSPQLSQYRYVHFATHGFYNDIHPELSGIALSLINEQGEELKEGFLLTPDVFNLNLPAEMVVLSGCRTAEGKEVKGEGIVGLTRGLMYAGARRVVVSLWSVNDLATAEFMGRFYRGILQEGLSPTKALRATQLEMWEHKQWQEPYYWAAFVLQGEYQ